MLGPTSPALLDPETRPYFLWWGEVTVRELRKLLRSPDPEERAYWLGSIMREANTRDVWVFATRDDIEALWPRLIRYLGKSLPMWSWLLGLPSEWPPEAARRG